MYYKQTEAEERIRLADDMPQADDVVNDDEELAVNGGNDTFSSNGDKDEFLNQESISGDTVTNNATIT